MTDLGEWYRSVPRITRWWFTGSLVLPLLGRFGLLPAQWMYLSWDTLMRFQIWRPVTALFFYPVSPMTGFHWLFMLFFLYNYSKNLENDVFSGRPADYFWMLTVHWIVCCGLAMAAQIYFLLDTMVISVLYVWCQLNKDTIVSFWFGTQFKAMYLPWILLIFNAVIRGGGLNDLIGILVGHFYFFLAFKYPQEHGGPSLVQTPQFLYNYLPNETGGVHGFGSSNVQRRPNQAGGGGAQPHRWGGAGRPLGNE